MPSIVMKHILPTFLPVHTPLSSAQSWVFGSNRYWVEEYHMVGGVLHVPTNLVKLRTIERIGESIVERYGYTRMRGDDRLDDLSMVFMRVLDGRGNAKFLVNRMGCRQAINEFNSFVSERDRPTSKSTSLFVNDMIVADECDECLPVLVDSQVMSNYYQTEYTDAESMMYPFHTLNRGLSPREELIDKIHAISQVGKVIDEPEIMFDSVLCDTGQLRKIDSLSWVCRDGGMNISDVKKYTAPTDSFLVCDIVDMADRVQHPLDLTRCYRVAYALQLSPMTEFTLRYILHNGDLVLDGSNTEMTDRYQLTTYVVRDRYVNALAGVLREHWPHAVMIEVRKNYQHDATVTVRGVNGKSICFYVDLTLSGILTRSLVHL